MTNLTSIDNVTKHFDTDAYLDNNATSFFALKSYEDFVAITEKTLQKTLSLLEANPKFLQLSEDEITNIVCVSLRMAGINADHDSMEGGHADIVIKNLRHKWLAEAKIKDDTYDYSWLWDGFMQLTERYATNTAGSTKAGFLVYIKQANSQRVMDRWKDHMTKAEGYTFEFKDSPFPISFMSTHSHTRFGVDCHVTHFSLSAYFNPVK